MIQIVSSAATVAARRVTAANLSMVYIMILITNVRYRYPQMTREFFLKLHWS